MGKLFDAIFESVVARHDYLTGDLVKFRPNYKSCDAYKSMSTELKKEVDDLATCGLNIKVVQVGDKLSGASAGNQFKTSDSYVITIAADQGGTRIYGKVTVSSDMIDKIPSDDINLSPIPDEWKRKEKITIKPEVLKVDNNHITRKTDKGNGKATPTEYKLPESTTLKKDNELLGMLYEAASNPNRLSDSEKHQITNKLTIYGLDGNARFETAGQALRALTSALDELGFDLDAVTNDVDFSRAHHEPGYKAQKMLSFRRKSMSGDPFDEEPEIENSMISFNFENLGRNPGGKDIEVVAYAS